MSGKMKHRHRRVLERLNEAAPNMVSFRGLPAIAAARLAVLEYVEWVADDKWGGSIYRITPAGRRALEGGSDG